MTDRVTIEPTEWTVWCECGWETFSDSLEVVRTLGDNHECPS